VVRDFKELLQAKWCERKFVCVGLDSDASKLPVRHLGLRDIEGLLKAQAHYTEYMKYLADPENYEKQHSKVVPPLAQWEKRLLGRAQLAFNKQHIKANSEVAAAFKPNAAFYEAVGDAGWWALQQTIQFVNKNAPSVPVIQDGKRGDIGNTNIGYVMAAALADAVTVPPYMGWESLKPVLDQKHKGVFVLAKTSNPGSGEFQDLEVHLGAYYADTCEAMRGPLYVRVASHAASPNSWNYNGNCGVVAGATYPEEVAKIRRIIGDDVPMLNPGVGSQGGGLKPTVLAAVNRRGNGFLVNNSGKVNFASPDADFAEAGHVVVVQMNDDINAVLAAA